MMKNQLTIAEALEQGYTHWAFESDEPFVRKLSEIKPENFEDTTRLFLVDKNGYKFTIDAKTIEELVTDYLADQDEVADEDCELCDLASEADYEPLAKDINERLSTKTYFNMTDIELINQVS